MFGKSLRSRVFFALTLLSLVPLLITAYQGYHCGRMVVMDLMGRHADSIAEARQAIIAQWVIERERDLESLSSVPLLTSCLEKFRASGDESSINDLTGTLHAIQSRGAHYQYLAVYDSTWRPVAASEGGEHADASNCRAELEAITPDAPGVYVGPVHRHADGAVGVHMARVVRGEDGETLGFLTANLDLSRSLVPLLKDPSGLWSTGAVYIVDSESKLTVGAAEGMEAAQTRSENGTRMDTAQASDKAGTHAARTIIASRALPLGDLRLIVQFDTDEAMAAVRVLLYRATGMVSAALVAVMLVSIWISRLIGGPLANLASVARRISEGQFNERMKPMRLREADEVREAFNQMLDELRDKELVIVRSARLAAVGELTSRVVHEMRNPLSSIKMNLQAIRWSGALDSADLELAEIAEDQTRRLDRMLNELLLYGRPVELRLEPVGGDRVFELIPTEVFHLAEAKGVRIAVEVGDNLASQALSLDVEQFSRVLVNLVKNAIEASEKGAKIGLSARLSDGPKPEIAIEVRDQGCGIRPEHLEFVFRPFFTTKSEGTGLGLANVQKIVELHSGRVFAVNHADGGASFLVELPCAVEAAGSK